MISIVALNIKKCDFSPFSVYNYIHGVAADVFVLSEYNHNKNCKMLRKLLIQNLYYIEETPMTNNKGSVALVSRFKIPVTTGMLDQNLIECSIDNITIGGCYLRMGKDKKEFWDRLHSHLKTIDKPYLLIGDYNNGDQDLDRDEKGTPFQASNSFLQLKDIGFSDAYRRMYLIEREFSWYSNKGNGFRIDHAFEKNLLVKRIQYDHFPRLHRISDHSALIVEI